VLGVIAVVLVFFHAQVYFLFYPHTQDDVMIQVFKNREIFSVIQRPQSVTAQRLHPKYDSSGTSDGYTNNAPPGLSHQQIQAIHSPKLSGYTDTPVELSPKEIQDLQNLSDSGILFGYAKAAPVGLSPEQIQTIQKLLEKPASYRWSRPVNCIPEYGVLFNFHSDGRTVRVAFCFRCGQLGVFDGEDDSKEQINRVDMFNPMRGRVLAICKEIFPNDKEIQELK
jgi:hypothetical protein